VRHSTRSILPGLPNFLVRQRTNYNQDDGQRRYPPKVRMRPECEKECTYTLTSGIPQRTLGASR